MTRTLVAITSFVVLAAPRVIAQQPGSLRGVPPLRLAADTLALKLPPSRVMLRKGKNPYDHKK